MIGVDVAKAKLDITLDGKRVVTIDNTHAAYKVFLKTLMILWPIAL